MFDDRQLLRRYAVDGSEAAFREIVERYLNLVYSAALRRVGNDAHLAQDVSQLVFTDLARKIRSLPENVVLAGWLHRATRFAAAQAMRTNQRRLRREQEAVAMNELQTESGPDWQAIRPALDDALDELNQSDRDALLLRFFEQRSLAEVGRALGANEDAARKRVSRAIDKLRTILVRRGLTTTAATLSGIISANAVQLAPAGLATTLASASLAGAGTTTGAAVTILKIMSMTKLQVAIGTTAIALLTASLVLQHQRQNELRRDNDSLRKQVTQLNSDKESLSARLTRSAAFAPRLPAPAVQAVSSDPTVSTMQSTNLYDRMKDKDLKLTAEQVASYLKTNNRSASSLLAAYRTSKDPELLAEAMRNFPNDPQVAFEAALRKDATPDERRQWIDALEKSDPDNALGNYLSALEYFKAGQSDQAIQQMLAANGKSFQDYTSERYQDDTEAYLAAGYSSADAKMASGLQLLLPQLQQVKDLGHDLVDLANSYQQQGDPASAQSAIQMAINLGQRYGETSPGEPAISQLVGLALETIALKNMDPNTQYGNNGQTVQDYLNQIQQQKTALQDRSTQVESIAPTLTEQDWIIYRDRWLMFGEQNAEQWVISKYGQK